MGGGGGGPAASPPPKFQKFWNFSGKTLIIRATAVEIKLKKKIKKNKKTTVIPKRQAKWTHAKSKCVVSIKC